MAPRLEGLLSQSTGVYKLRILNCVGAYWCLPNLGGAIHLIRFLDDADVSVRETVWRWLKTAYGEQVAFDPNWPNDKLLIAKEGWARWWGAQAK
jgi:hypothetical protein